MQNRVGQKHVRNITSNHEWNLIKKIELNKIFDTRIITKNKRKNGEKTWQNRRSDGLFEKTLCSSSKINIIG